MTRRFATRTTLSQSQRDEMSRAERVRAAVAGEPVDRLPVCFWHHFKPNGSGRALAEATRHFFDETFDLDIAKIMPDLPYPLPLHSIRTVDDWRLIEPLDRVRSHFMIERARAVRVLREALGDDTPIIMTVFSPLGQVMRSAADTATFFAHAETAPAVVHGALSTVAENLRAHIRDVIEAGADGVFFALSGCTTAVMPEQQYREFGRSYDLIALQGAIGGWLNVLHVHGERDLMFEQVLDYPVHMLSWSDRLAGPSLRDARTMTDKCLMGGWHEFGALSNGPEEAILVEAQDALAQTGGRKLILANGCSVPDETAERWLHYAREVVDTLEVA